MWKEAALVFTVVLGATGAALTLFPGASPRAEPALRASITPAPAPAPVAAKPAGPAPSAVRKAEDGHFWAEAQVEGALATTSRVKFLVDTGATIVALTPEDARRLGLDPADLDYGLAVRTAAGQTQAARVRLAAVSVAGARVEDVDAVVVRQGLENSLLGMSYLGRLSRFEATQSALILRP